MKTKTFVALGALLALAALAPTASATYTCDSDTVADPTGAGAFSITHNYCYDAEGSPIIAGSISGHVGPKPVHSYYWVG